MDNIAGTGFEQERQVDTHPPALLVIILDTNPSAWQDLLPYLPLDTFLADLLVLVNAHLACNHANRVALLASHCSSTHWLYPSPLDDTSKAADSKDHDMNGDSNDDPTDPQPNPNQYRPFAVIEHTVRRNLRQLFARTTADDIAASLDSTTLASTLSVAIGHISRVSTSSSSSSSSAGPSTTNNPEHIGQSSAQGSEGNIPQNARILIVSTSGSLASQYIPLMNLIFASQHLRIPLDILKLAGDTVLLQQASYTTQGIFLAPVELPDLPSPSSSSDNSPTNAANPESPTKTNNTTKKTPPLLPTLLLALLPDPATRRHLVPPTAISVDFRAACFCHRRVVDIGFVCSICLSIFCEEGVGEFMLSQSAGEGDGEGEKGVSGVNGATSSVEGQKQVGGAKKEAACLTCGTALSLKVLGGGAGADGAVLEERPRKKKKKRRKEGEGAEGTQTPR